jgi:hypothetical protein
MIARARGSGATARATVGRTTAAESEEPTTTARCYLRSSDAFFTIAGGVW